MSDARGLGQLSARQQQALGMTPGTKAWSPFPFAGINQSATRAAMDDKEFFFLENYVRVGDGNLRTVWDLGSPIYRSASDNILSFFWFNIGETQYCAIFFTDGTAVQVQQSTLTVTTISNVANTFFRTGGSKPACVQWGTQYLLISNNNTNNDYWVWDGSILYGAGGLAPTIDLTSGGSGYSFAPTVSIFGGSGSGMVAHAHVAGGSVVKVHITNPGTGWLPGETVQFAFSGGGSDPSPALRAVLTATTIGHIALLAGGTGFADGTYNLGFSGGGGGAGGAATYTCSGGTVVGISLTNPGAGYTALPLVSFPSGGGTGAIGEVILSPTTVGAVAVDASGQGFSGTPTLTFVGGGGTGAAGTCNMVGGAINTVTMTNNGSGYTMPPGVEVQVGVNNAAMAIATLMPFGISGDSIETFQQRVWLPFPNEPAPEIQNGGVFQVSAPESFTDFATSDGGLIFTNTDRFLRQQYVNLRQSNGYLYPIGDSSVSVISNVSTGGSPTSTTFNYQNVDPQIGATWRDSLQDFSTTILFANALGVFGVYGGRAVKVSKNLDMIFDNAIFPPITGAVIPSAASASIFNIKHYLLLMTILDPLTNSPRTVMAAWNEKDWVMLSQSTDLTYIGTQEVASDLFAWGTDGTAVYPLFARPSSDLTKRIATKAYGGPADFMIKDLLGFYMKAQDNSQPLAGIDCSVTFDLTGAAVQPTFPPDEDMPSLPSTTVGNIFQQPVFQAPPPYWYVFGTGCGGIPCFNVSCTIETNSPDFTLANLILTYYDLKAYQ